MRYKATTELLVFPFVVIISLLVSGSIVLLSYKPEYGKVFLLLAGPLFGFLVLVSVFPHLYSRIRLLFLELKFWHILWFFLFLSGLVFRVRGTLEARESPLDFWALYRIGLVGVVALILLAYLLLKRSYWFPWFFKGLIGLVVFFSMVNISSALWSVYPLWTLYKSVEYLTGVILVAMFCYSVKTVRDFKTLFDWTWFLVGLLVCTVWLGVLIWPESAVNHGVGLIGIQIKGVLPAIASNGVGDLGAILGIVAFVRLIFKTRHARFYLLVFIVGMVTLILSQTRSSLVGFLLTIPLTLFLARRISFSTLLIVSLLGFFFAGFMDLFFQFFLRGQTEGLFFSLSGRLYWWKHGLEQLKEQPVIGFGAYAGGRFVTLADLGADIVSSLHSTWMEVLLGTGIVGFLFIFMAVLRTWVTLLKPIKGKGIEAYFDSLRVEAVGILTLLSVRSIFSVTFIWHPALTWFLVLGYAEFIRRYRNNLSYHRKKVFV